MGHGTVVSQTIVMVIAHTLCVSRFGGEGSDSSAWDIVVGLVASRAFIPTGTALRDVDCIWPRGVALYTCAVCQRRAGIVSFGVQVQIPGEGRAVV